MNGPRPPRPRAAAQRGAALLLAMIIVTLVATLAAAMVWQQARAVQLEAAERARSQAEWVLAGALDWARLILRRTPGDAGKPTWINDPWATPLAEARLSTFLAADASGDTDDGPDAFLSGLIVDAQSRYNLRNLVGDDRKIAPAELKAFERLCDAVGLPSDVPSRLAEGLRRAWAPSPDDGRDQPIPPTRVEHLAWLGIDAATLQRLAPYVSLLPARTPVNVNTASREALLAAVDGLDLGSAERLVQLRQRQAFATLDAVRAALPPDTKIEESRLGVGSSFFDVYGRLRLDERIVEERSLVERRGDGSAVVALRRERRQFVAAPTR